MCRRALGLLSLSAVFLLSAPRAAAGVRRVGMSIPSGSAMALVRAGRVVALAEGETHAAASVPGSLPLDNATENRIGRYLVQDRCPSTQIESILERCRFLLLQQRELRRTTGKVSRLSPRANNVLEEVRGGRTVERRVEDEYQRGFRNARAFIRVQSQRGGLVGRPRNLRETSESFREAVKRGRAVRETDAEVEEGE